MKKIVFILCGLICSFSVWGQKANCGCTKEKIQLDEPISCDAIVFKNGAKLYWQWNCDSIWLTYENDEKIIIRTCETRDINLCPKIGFVFVKEYPTYLLFKDVLYADLPFDIVFMNKNDGTEYRRIKKDEIVQHDIDKNYLLYFSDASCKKLVYLDYNNTMKFKFIEFETKKVSNSADKNGTDIAGVFSNFKQNDDNITFDFKNADGQVENLKIAIK